MAQKFMVQCATIERRSLGEGHPVLKLTELALKKLGEEAPSLSFDPQRKTGKPAWAPASGVLPLGGVLTSEKRRAGPACLGMQSRPQPGGRNRRCGIDSQGEQQYPIPITTEFDPMAGNFYKHLDLKKDRFASRLCVYLTSFTASLDITSQLREVTRALCLMLSTN